MTQRTTVTGWSAGAGAALEGAGAPVKRTTATTQNATSQRRFISSLRFFSLGLRALWVCGNAAIRRAALLVLILPYLLMTNTLPWRTSLKC